MNYHIPDFNKSKVLVVGDVMLDQYWHGVASRISPEAPVPVVNVQGKREQPGGAGNVALNLRALGADVRLFGLIGSDKAGETLESQLNEQGITTYLKKITGMHTITKLRVIGRNQQLIRLDFEQGFHHVDMDGMLADIESQLPMCQAMIISDYNKGIAANMHALIAMANQAQIPVLIDPKNADFSIYNGATVLTPNYKEFENVVGPCHGNQEIEDKGQQLLRDYNIEALLVTRGEHGMTLISRDQPAFHIEAHALEVYDVTGAGDTVIASLTAALTQHVSLNEAVMLANTAAGIAVRKLGAATVTVPELRRELQKNLESDVGILTEKELLVALTDARAHGETIVMTNGCFDILHAGHVTYLEEAKALGKRLLVAINDDNSVARLKGEGRPIVPLQERMTVLSALRAVDWVVPFSENTPQRLIGEVMPDVLVKGADYQHHEIAGAQQVKEAGGRVETIKLVDGVSSTNIIDAIRG